MPFNSISLPCSFGKEMESTSKWPSGARATICLTMDNMGEAADLDRDLWPKDEPVGQHYSVLQVLPKFLAMLKQYDIKATYFIESWNLSVYPEATKSVAAAGHEVAWHAWRHEAWSKLDESAEKANFERSFGDEGLKGFNEKRGAAESDVHKYLGFRPPGGIIHGDRTLQQCRDHGLNYISPAAEHAAVVPVGNQGDKIAVLPFRWSTVDAYYYMPAFGKLRQIKGQYGEEPQTPKTLAAEYIRQIDETIESGGFLSLLFHPFLTDRPERLEATETVVKHLVKRRGEGKIWLARCQEVARWLGEHPDAGAEDPGWDETSWR